MRLNNLLIFGLILSFLLSYTTTYAQTPSNTQTKADLLIALTAQLQSLQEQLANLLKYQPGKPLNTITEIIGPRIVTEGEYNNWKFVTQNNDPGNSSIMIDWGDGMTSVSGSGHTYNTPGTYTLTATSRDGNGEPSSKSLKVTVVASKKESALTAWGNKLVTNKSLIPDNKFRSYFFNTENFKTVSKPNIVDQPFLIYPNYTNQYNEPVGENNLAAYWVGSFSYQKDTTIYIDYSNPQWDSVRFVVNGKTVIDTNKTKHSKVTEVTLKKGKHTIEVEYLVNWHAGFFRAKVGTINPSYTDINSALDSAKKIAGNNASVVTTNEYSPADILNGVTTVSIPNNTAPKILNLESYEPTVWDVTDAKARGVKAIIVSSLSGAADVINAGDIPVFRTKNYSN